MAKNLLLLALLIFTSGAQAQNLPKGSFVPEESLSPDKRLGVTVPMVAAHPEGDDRAKNSLVDVKTGQVLAVIDARTGWDHGNHNTVLPARWSRDGALLLWEVDGKWFSWALVLLKMEKNKVLWQRDLLKAGQQAILTATQKAAPDKYVLAKKANEGNGSAYPEGFSVDVEIVGPVKLPLNFLINLTSNPKGIEGHYTLESHLEGSLDGQGNFTFKNFGFGESPGHSW